MTIRDQYRGSQGHLKVNHVKPVIQYCQFSIVVPSWLKDAALNLSLNPVLNTNNINEYFINQHMQHHNIINVKSWLKQIKI